MSMEMVEILEAWLSDPELEGQDATATLSDLVSNLPAELVDNVQISLKGFLEAVKGGNK